MEEFLQFYKAASPAFPATRLPRSPARAGAGAEGPRGQCRSGWGSLGKPGQGRGRSCAGEVQGDNHPRASPTPAPSSRAPLPPQGSQVSHARPQLCALLLPWDQAFVPSEGSGQKGRHTLECGRADLLLGIIPRGEQEKGAMTVVSTGVEQTVPIRINPHPFRWTGLLRTPPPLPYSTAVPNTGASRSSWFLLRRRAPKIPNKSSSGAPCPSKGSEDGGNNFQCRVMNLQEATWGLN